jgi:hypothetical protein
MAKIIKKLLGTYLLPGYLEGNSPGDLLPSPESLKCKILIKGKKLKVDSIRRSHTVGSIWHADVLGGTKVCLCIHVVYFWCIGLCDLYAIRVRVYHAVYKERSAVFMIMLC